MARTYWRLTQLRHHIRLAAAITASASATTRATVTEVSSALTPIVKIERTVPPIKVSGNEGLGNDVPLVLTPQVKLLQGIGAAGRVARMTPPKATKITHSWVPVVPEN